MRRSAQVLRAAAAAQDHGGGEVHPAAWHLARAAGQLAAGRDLLHTHFSSDPAGAWTGTSSWARVIYSPPVTDAMLGEIGGLAAQLAPWMMRLSLEPAPDSVTPAAAGLALHDSSRWLWTAGLKLEARSRQHPPAGDTRLVLASIPSALPPAHQPVAATDSVPDLCQGVLTTAARLQHAADAFARTARWSPQATSHSWGRSALACAITAHSSEVIVRSLSQRAAALDLDPHHRGAPRRCRPGPEPGVHRVAGDRRRMGRAQHGRQPRPRRQPGSHRNRRPGPAHRPPRLRRPSMDTRLRRHPAPKSSRPRPYRR